MKRRLLLTGYGGFVAGGVVRHALTDWEVHVVGRRRMPADGTCAGAYQFDLRDSEKLREVFERVRPHSVIHAAAMADIDYCESHPEEATEINLGVTKTIAALCREQVARMIFCSTDTVFDGRKGNYTELDAPNPVNHYARTKIAAERHLLESGGDIIVSRLSLVLGFPLMGSGNSFLAKSLNELQNGRNVFFPVNEIRTPVDVVTLGKALLELASGDWTGVIHLAGNTCRNRYEIAQYCLHRLGFSPGTVLPSDSSGMEGRARRPEDASLDNTLARRLLRTPMLSLEDAMDVILETREEQQNAFPRNQA